MRAKVQPDHYCLLHLLYKISYCLDERKPLAGVAVLDFLFPVPHCRGRRVLPEGFDSQLCGRVDHREGRSDHRPAAERDWSHHQTVKIQRLLPRWVSIHRSPSGLLNCSSERTAAVISDCANTSVCLLGCHCWEHGMQLAWALYQLRRLHHLWGLMGKNGDSDSLLVLYIQGLRWIPADSSMQPPQRPQPPCSRYRGLIQKLILISIKVNIRREWQLTGLRPSWTFALGTLVCCCQPEFPAVEIEQIGLDYGIGLEKEVVWLTTKNPCTFHHLL